MIHINWKMTLEWIRPSGQRKCVIMQSLHSGRWHLWSVWHSSRLDLEEESGNKFRKCLDGLVRLVRKLILILVLINITVHYHYCASSSFFQHSSLIFVANFSVPEWLHFRSGMVATLQAVWNRGHVVFGAACYMHGLLTSPDWQTLEVIFHISYFNNAHPPQTRSRTDTRC